MNKNSNKKMDTLLVSVHFIQIIGHIYCRSAEYPNHAHSKRHSKIMRLEIM